MIRRGIPEYFRLRPRSSAEIARQVDEEIDVHLELHVQELVERGATPEVARAEAERRFGEVAGARACLRDIAEERERRMSASEWLSGLRQDIRYAARALRREPVVALVVVVTMALGIGANVVMFGIIDELLVRGPAHVVAPEQVQRVYLTQRGAAGNESTRSHTAYIVYAQLRMRTDAFAHVATYHRNVALMGRGEQAREVPVGWSTHELFELLGVSAHLGRFYSAEEVQPKQPHYVAVVDYDFWQNELGGAADVIGRTVALAEATGPTTQRYRTYTIIGVAPKGFTGAERTPVALWLPLSTSYEPVDNWPTSWNASWLHVIARVRPDVGQERATEAAAAAYQAAAADAPAARREVQLSLRPISYTMAGNEPAEFAVSRWLGGVSLIVLLVACANVINLLLARGVRRRRELAARQALGITRARLVRLLLSETLLLAFAGGLLAALLAHWGAQFMRATLLPDVQWAAPLTLRVLFFTALTIVLTAVLIGLAPALQAGRHDVTSGWKASGGQGGTRRSGVRSALTVLQAALSLVLLVGAGLFVRSLWHARTLWPAEDPFTKCIYIGSGDDRPCSRVVGIAEDTKQWGLRDEPAMQYYVPFGQEREVGGTHIVVRTREDAANFVPQLRRFLHQVEPTADYFAINPLQRVLDPQLRPWRLGATMFLIFGALALLIAGIGLYSVVAYGVAQRRTEIGVRVALGARAATIVGLVAREGLRLVLLGILLGLPLALVGGRMVETLLFDTASATRTWS